MDHITWSTFLIFSEVRLIDKNKLNHSQKYQERMIFLYPHCVDQIETFLGQNFMKLIEISPTAKNYLKLSKNQKYKFFNIYPEEISKIEGLISNLEMRDLIKNNPFLVFHLKNPKQSFWKIVLKKSKYYSHHSNQLSKININNLCFENQIRLLRIYPYKITYLSKQSHRLCWFALRSNPKVISGIRKPSNSMALYAVQNFIFELGIRKPKSKLIDQTLDSELFNTLTEIQKRMVRSKLILQSF